MSRIHQALKKAQQERAANSIDDFTLPDIPDITVAPVIPPVRPRDLTDTDSILTPSLPASPLPRDYLRFEDLRAHCASVHWRLDPQLDVFSDPTGAGLGAEQFRTLRSRLYQLRNDHHLKTVLITSSEESEGKTFISTNLVQVLVRQPDRRALIIDADMRRPRLHTIWGTAASPGLSDYLSGSADEIAITQHDSTVGNLCLIPNGSVANKASELLLNGRMKTLIDRMAPAFDWIIIDSPPCLPVADATVLADVCDGVLLVVRAACTATETAQRACQELQSKKLIGVVLNGAETGSHYGSYGYYTSREGGNS